MVPASCGYFGFNVATGGAVMGCGLPSESRACKSTETVQEAGFGLEMSTRHKFPCKSPAYAMLANAEDWPLVLTTIALDSPLAAARLQAVGTAAHRSTLKNVAPVCGFNA